MSVKLAVVGKAAGVAKRVVKVAKNVDLLKAVDNINVVGDVVDKFHSPKKKSRAEAMEELKKLKELLDMGVLTEEEFAEKKKKLLDMI